MQYILITLAAMWTSPYAYTDLTIDRMGSYATPAECQQAGAVVSSLKSPGAINTAQTYTDFVCVEKTTHGESILLVHAADQQRPGSGIDRLFIGNLTSAECSAAASQVAAMSFKGSALGKALNIDVQATCTPVVPGS